jgi:hypothetical protein
MRQIHRPQELTALHRALWIASGIISLAVLICVTPANAQKTYTLSVSRHRDVPALSAQEIAQILAKASQMLKKDTRHDSENDVACNVAFALKGPVRVFGSPDTPAVVDEHHIAAVHRVDDDLAGVDFHIKVVKKIKFCLPGVSAKQFDGCSYSPKEFRSTIVVHPSLHKDIEGRPISNYPDHLLWAHEFGHLTGLPHRCDDSALMSSDSVARFANGPDARVHVTRDECRCFQSGPGVHPGQGPCQPPPRIVTCSH